MKRKQSTVVRLKNRHRIINVKSVKEARCVQSAVHDIMEKKDIKLNFDAAKHDAKVQAAEIAEAERKQKPAQRAIKKRAHAIMERFKKKAKSMAITPQELIAMTYRLQTDIGELRAEAVKCGLEEWHTFTMSMIEDKIATMVATGITAKNEIVQYIPDNPTMLDKENNDIVRDQLQRDVKPVQFRTLEELYAIPFVAAVKAKAGFVGFVLHGIGLVATFNDGENVGVGFLANGVGVDKLPTLEDYVAALAAANSDPADAGGADGAAESGSGTPGPTPTSDPNPPTSGPDGAG